MYFCVLQLTSLQILTVQTATVQQPWPSTTRPCKLCLKEKIQTTRMSLIYWIWNFKPEEHSSIQIPREDDRHKKVIEAYPCFKDIGHVSRY